MRLWSRLTGTVAMAVAVAGFVSTPAAASPALSKTVKVVAMGGTCTSFFCYQPKFVSVIHNNSVTWKNVSGVTHTISRCTPAACSGHGPGSGTQSSFGDPSLANGQTYTFLFQSTGTYNYYCAIHGYSVMHGKVTVT